MATTTSWFEQVSTWFSVIPFTADAAVYYGLAILLIPHAVLKWSIRGYKDASSKGTSVPMAMVMGACWGLGAGVCTYLYARLWKLSIPLSCIYLANK